MRILLLEWVTSGLASDDCHADDSEDSKSADLQLQLAAEGKAMLAAAAADFAAIADTQVVVLVADRTTINVYGVDEVRVDRQSRASVLAREARRADLAVVIAPETGGELARWTTTLAAKCVRVLGPDVARIELASNKHLTAEWLRAQGVLAPAGFCWVPGDPLPRGIGFPAVVKPVDGVGSSGVVRVDNTIHLDAVLRSAMRSKAGAGRGLRIEAYHPGTPASVVVFCGPGGQQVLPACGQRIAQNTELKYEGGYFPLPPSLEMRAQALVGRARRALDGWLGYLGFDVVLGPAIDGSQDVVIEVNPRWTTSYLGLRSATRANLAEHLLAAAGLLDQPRTSIEFDCQPLEFDLDGTVRLIR